MFTGARVYIATIVAVAVVAIALGNVSYAIGFAVVGFFAYPRAKKRDERRP